MTRRADLGIALLLVSACGESAQRPFVADAAPPDAAPLMSDAAVAGDAEALDAEQADAAPDAPAPIDAWVGVAPPSVHCEIATLVRRAGALGGLAQTETYLYWTETADEGPKGSVVRVAKDGGAPQMLFTVRGRAQAIGATTDGAPVFFGSMGGDPSDAIVSVDPETRDGTVLVDGLDRPLAIEARSDAVYWTDQGRDGQDGGARRVDLTTREVTTLATPLVNAHFLALDDTHVYFATYFGNGVDPVGVVNRVAQRGGPLTSIAGEQPPFLGFAVDGGFVYWASLSREEGEARISRAEAAGGAAEVLNRDAVIARGLVVDDALMWAGIGADGTAGLFTQAREGGPARFMGAHDEVFLPDAMLWDDPRSTLYFGSSRGTSEGSEIVIASCHVVADAE